MSKSTHAMLAEEALQKWLTHSQLRIAQRDYISCFWTILFCTDDCCSIPLHTLPTDTVESQGGSALLVEILNRQGICVSADILSRFIQLCVKQTPSNTVSQARPNPSITHGLVTLDRFLCVTLWWPCRQSDWLWSHDLLISTGETAELENRHGASTYSTPT